jgi:CRISPR system Cascade subunit CasE
MWISCLLIDVGDNPDRPRPGRQWLRNLYRVHQRLCMAFPSDRRKQYDPEFLKPYQPEDFGNGHVHVERGPTAGFLFRLDPEERCCREASQARHSGSRVVILVQSAPKPDWEYAFHNACYLLAAPPEVKPFNPCYTTGQRLRFRLLANPTRRLTEHSLGADGQLVKKWANTDKKGMRVPVPTDQLLDWINRRAEKAGFSIEKDSINVLPGYVFANKRGDRHGIRLRSVRYDGLLSVTEPALFRQAIIQGIGPGKAFGFGLLSVAPCCTGGL